MNNETIKNDFMAWFKGKIDHYIEILNKEYEGYIIVNKTSESVDFRVKCLYIPLTTYTVLSYSPISIDNIDEDTLLIRLSYENFANFIVDEYCS